MSSFNFVRPLMSYSAFLKNPESGLFFILPTAELVQQFKEFDELFVFYKGGIRGAIQDIILNADIDAMLTIPDRATEKMVERIVAEYQNSAEAVCLHLLENTTNETYVEIIALLIEQAVRDLLLPFFGEVNFHFHPCMHQWRNDDFIAHVTFEGRR